MRMRPCTLGALGVVRTQGDAGRVPGGGDRMPGNFKAQEKPRAPRLGCEIKRRGQQRGAPAGGPESRSLGQEGGSLASAACPPPLDVRLPWTAQTCQRPGPDRLFIQGCPEYRPRPPIVEFRKRQSVNLSSSLEGLQTLAWSSAAPAGLSRFPVLYRRRKQGSERKGLTWSSMMGSWP